MSIISDSFCEAVETIVETAVSKLNYDRTVKATIYKVVNVDSGIYQVKYEGSILTAYADDTSKTYKIEEEIYMRVPEGDFSNTKIIIGRVTENSLSEGQMVSLANTIIDISPTFDNFYSFNTDSPWKVIAGPTKDLDYIYGSENNTYDSTSQYHGLFQQYANKYQYIKIKADFKTQFHNIHIKGNYGIEVAFFAKGEDNTYNTVVYRLDMESFTGDPYSLSVFSPQQVVFKVQTNYLLGLKYVRLFQEDFEYDSYISDPQYPDNRTDIKDTPNIFAENVEINYVDIVDLTAQPYYCYIATPKGSIFSSASNSLDLQVRLLSYGEELSTDDCTYKWFKRDLSIAIGNELYDKDVGFGWAPITDEEPYTTFSNNNSTMTISADALVYQQRYKCIVVYNEQVVMTAEKEILNIKNNYGYHIEQITEGDVIKLNLVNDSTEDTLIGDWYVSFPDNSYLSVDELVNSIEIQDYLTYSSVTFYCGVYSYDGTTIVGTIEHTIYNSESEDDLTITYIGEDTFRYDANGDITVEDSEKERTLQISLSWKEGYGTSYRIEWLGPDGKEIPTSKDEGYSPENSMMENIWVDISNILHYNIKYKYKVNYNNNTFTLKVITIDEKVYTFGKEILFMKDGDQGTNGTTYVAVVRPCDNNGQKLSGFQALRYYSGGYRGRDPENSSSSAGLTLKCYVYKDGEFINDDTTNYSISYIWTGVGVDQQIYKNSSLVEDPQRIVVTGKSDETIPSTFEFFGDDEDRYESLSKYVTITVRISDKKNDRQTTIYALYPIDVIYGRTLESEIDISDIPSYIKYTSSGINPSFYSNNITFTYNDLTWTGSPKQDGAQTTVDATQGISSITPRIIGVTEKEEDGVYLSPASSFIFEEDTIAVLKCQYNVYNFVLHPIVMYLDTYGNEAINGWDGTTLQITNGYYYIANGLRTYLTPEEEKDFYSKEGDSNTYILVNGVEYVVQEGDAHILAPQIGAGEKDSNNRFTGVVMGKDTGQDKIGLYGYKEGRSSFGLLEDGTAYFGIAGHSGRIEIDGEKGTITSGNYLEGSDSVVGNGMQIDLDEGHIDSYNFLITSHNMTIDSGDGSFEFRLGMSTDETANNDSIRDNSKFRIYFPTGKYYDLDDNEIYEDSEKDVFLVKRDQYFLQTRNFSNARSILESNISNPDEIVDLFSEEEESSRDIPAQGTKIDLQNGKITSYDFTIKTPTMEIESGIDGDSTFEFDVSNKGIFDIEATYQHLPQTIEKDFTTSSGTTQTETFEVSPELKKLFYVKGESGSSADDLDKYYLQTLNFISDGSSIVYKNIDSSETIEDRKTLSVKQEGQGTKIDLQNGKITSYDFTIKTPTLDIESKDGTEGSKFGFDVSNDGRFYIKATYYYPIIEKEFDNSELETYAATPDEDKYIFYATGNEEDNDRSQYYLSSLDFITQGTKIEYTNTDPNETIEERKKMTVISDGQGTKIDLQNGKITSYDFTIKTPTLTIESKDTTDNNNSKISFDVSSTGVVDIYSSYKYDYSYSCTYTNTSGKEITLDGVYTAQDSNHKPIFYVKGGESNTSEDTNTSYYLQTINFFRAATVDVTPKDAKEQLLLDIPGKGTKIDLENGKITSYDFSLSTPALTLESSDEGSQFKFNVSNGLFQIYTDDKILFYAKGQEGDGGERYYLQSSDYGVVYDDEGNGTGTGTRIDLENGKITSYCFYLNTPKMTLKSENGDDGKGQFSFDVDGEGTFQIKYGSKKLLYIKGPESNLESSDEVDLGSFYIQSADYNYAKDTGVGEGLKIDLATGKINAYSFYLKTPDLTIQSESEDNGGAKFEFDVYNKGTFSIKNDSKRLFYIRGTESSTLEEVDTTDISSVNGGSDSGTVEVLSDDDSGSFYLQSADYDVSNETGMKIDLANGRITAYDFTLRSPYLTISSNDSKGRFVFDAANGGSFQIKNSGASSSDNSILFQISGNTSSTSSSGSYFLRSQNFSRSTNMSTSSSTGMMINLNNGIIYAKSVELSGTIYATAGNIGGWRIVGGVMSYSDADGNIVISPSQIKFNNNFVVTGSGLTLNFSKVYDTDENSLETKFSTITTSVNGLSVTVGDIKTTVDTQSTNITKLETFANGFSLNSNNEFKFTPYGTNDKKTATIYSSAAIKGFVDDGISNISISATAGDSSASITLSATNSEGSVAAISSTNIVFTGLVTFAGLAAGTTKIDGGCIQSGTISAKYIKTNETDSWGLTISNHQISNSAGSITFNDTLEISAEFIAIDGNSTVTFTGTVELPDSTHVNGKTLSQYIKETVGIS